MTTHAAMVEGVRELVAEMASEITSLQQRFPISMFVLATKARTCLENEQYGEAANDARAVMATLRGVPAGAVQVEGYAESVLIAVVGQALETNRSNFTAAGGAEQTGARVRVRGALEKLYAQLAGAKAVYVVPNDAPITDQENEQ